VRNVSYEISESAIRKMFDKYGEIKKIFSLIQKRGMAFVTYFDSRHAEAAKKDMQGSELNGRPIDVHFSLPKDEEDQTQDDKNNGTLFVSVRNSSSHIKNTDMFSFFSQWGQVREVRDCRNSPTQKFVEYYDLRDAEKALASANGNDFYDQGVLDIKYAFVQTVQKDERRRKKEDEEEEEKSSVGPIRTRDQRKVRNNDNEIDTNPLQAAYDPYLQNDPQQQQLLVAQLTALAQLIQQQQAVSAMQPMLVMPNQTAPNMLPMQQQISPMVYPTQPQLPQQQLTPQQLQQLVGMINNPYIPNTNAKH